MMMISFRVTRSARCNILVNSGTLACALWGASAIAQSMPGMDHGSMSMPGMDHGSMPGMQKPASTPQASPAPASPSNNTQAVVPPPAAPGSQGATPEARTPDEAARAVPYRRNPDGTFNVPGMDMADNERKYLVMIDQLEYFKARRNQGQGLAWDGFAWYGSDYNKALLKAEGERIAGKATGRAEILWSRAFAAFWDTQIGLRHDFGSGPKRQWVALGVQGIAPYWFNIDTAFYVGENGRTAARLKAEYTFRLTQRAILTPEFETNAYGRADREREIGSGFSDVNLSLRLRYELRREIAPYIGISWRRKIGQTADFARQGGEPVTERQILAGVRIWF